MASASEESGPLTDLAHQASQRGGEIAHWLENHEPRDVLREVQSFARRRPVMFLAICAGRRRAGRPADPRCGRREHQRRLTVQRRVGLRAAASGPRFDCRSTRLRLASMVEELPPPAYEDDRAMDLTQPVQTDYAPAPGIRQRRSAESDR